MLMFTSDDLVAQDLLHLTRSQAIARYSVAGMRHANVMAQLSVSGASPPQLSSSLLRMKYPFFIHAPRKGHAAAI